MCRHCHNGTGTVAHQHVIRDPDRDLLAIDGIDRAKSVDLHARLILGKLRTLKVRLLGCKLTICDHLIPVLDLSLILVDQRMLRRDNHVGRTEQGIGTRRINAELILLACKGEIYLGALGLSDPVLLGNLYLFNIINRVKTLDQLLSILGDLEHPLALYLTDDFASAALADTVDHLFICKANLTGGTPVDGHFRLIRQPGFEELEEDPLRPFIILGIRGIDLAVPVEGIAKGMQLILKPCHVILGHDPGMNVILNCIVFRRQTKGIPAHGIQHVIALHSSLSCNDVQRRIWSGMTYVKSLS